jgi:hypothetical protein
VYDIHALYSVESPVGIWLKLVNEPKFGLDNIEETVILKQDQAEMVPLVHNTSMEDKTKVYSIHLLPSSICEATSWHLANSRPRTLGSDSIDAATRVPVAAGSSS